METALKAAEALVYIIAFKNQTSMHSHLWAQHFLLVCDGLYDVTHCCHRDVALNLASFHVFMRWATILDYTLVS